jgi:exopolyphosphatase/pppGpp-phosphohydrolase
MLVADIEPRSSLQIVASNGHNCGLAAALDATPQQRRETLAEVARVATGFAERCRAANAEHVGIFGTEVLRQLSAPDLEQLRGVMPSLVTLTPEVEALCSLLAAGYALPKARQKGDLLVIDQGAGSMELAVGRFHRGRVVLVSAVSHPLGAQPLLAQLRLHQGDFSKLRNALLTQSGDWILPKGFEGITPLVQGSVATKIAWLSKRGSSGDRYDPRLVQGVTITVQAMDALIARASREIDLVRRAIASQDSGEEEFDTFIASLVALRLMLQKVGASSFVTSSYGTRFGVAWHLVEPEAGLHSLLGSDAVDS